MTDWYIAVADMQSMASSVKSGAKDDEGNRLALWRAERAIEGLGHSVYYPRATISIRRLSKRVKIDRTLLYHYIFVGVEDGANFNDLRKTKGIYEILKDADGRYYKASQHDVDRFKMLERSGEYDETVLDKIKDPRLKPDTWVRVIDVTKGALFGERGITKRCHKLGMARVTFPGMFTLNLDVDCLELAP